MCTNSQQIVSFFHIKCDILPPFDLCCKILDATLNVYTVKCVMDEVALYDRWPLKRGSIHTKNVMTGQEKCDLLIQMTA